MCKKLSHGILINFLLYQIAMNLCRSQFVHLFYNGILLKSFTCYTMISCCVSNIRGRRFVYTRAIVIAMVFRHLTKCSSNCFVSRVRKLGKRINGVQDDSFEETIEQKLYMQYCDSTHRTLTSYQ